MHINRWYHGYWFECGGDNRRRSYKELSRLNPAQRATYARSRTRKRGRRK